MLLLVTHGATAQTDIFGSSDTVRIIEPQDGASSSAGAIIPVSIELHEDWEYEQVMVLIDGEMIKTFSPKGLIRFDYSPPDERIGDVEILVFANLAGENKGNSFAAQATVTILPAQLPVSLEVREQHILLSPRAEYVESIDVRAIYADGSYHRVSRDGFGVSFTPLTPSIVSIAEDGRIFPLEEGDTLVKVGYKGLEDWAYVAVYDRSKTPQFPAPKNIDSYITIEKSPLRRGPEINQYSQTLTLTNAIDLPIPPSIMVVLADLPEGIIVTSERAETSQTLEPKGSPMFLPGPWPNDLLLPGDSISFDVEFRSFDAGDPVYRPIVYNSGKY